jgi:hypothetical protein
LRRDAEKWNRSNCRGAAIVELASGSGVTGTRLNSGAWFSTFRFGGLKISAFDWGLSRFAAGLFCREKLVREIHEGAVFALALTPFHPAIQYARRHDFQGFYEQEIEFRTQLKYPPISRIALLTLKSRNEEKVRFSSEHLKREVEKISGGLKDLIIAGPAPAPLLRAESFYRYQLMLRTPQMPELSRRLARLIAELKLPDDVTLAVDVDPVNMA